MKQGRRKHLAMVAAIAVTGLLFAGTAQASVTIGSNLSTPASDNNGSAGECTVPCTVVNIGMPAANVAAGGLVSPVNGTVTSWRFGAGNTAVGIQLRILRPAGAGTFIGTGGSAPSNYTPVSPPEATPPILTLVPIALGDTVGLQSPNANLVLGVNPGATMGYWNLPPLADGAPRHVEGTDGAREALVQATIEPANAITFGKVKKNKKKGKAIVTMTVPNPGTLLYTHKGIKVVGPPTVSAPGEVQLVIKPKANVRRKLDKKGKARVGFNVRFTPTGGTLATQHENIKLRKKRKKG